MPESMHVAGQMVTPKLNMPFHPDFAARCEKQVCKKKGQNSGFRARMSVAKAYFFRL